MKNTYFLKTVFTLLLCGFFSMTYASTIFLSATGNDTNDGLTAGTAVKSLSRAQTLAADGDTIMVSGMIDVYSDPANVFTTTIAGPSTSNKVGIVIAKNLMIQGTSSTTDGFMGTDPSFKTTRLMQLITDLTLGLKNLKLANAALITDVATTVAGGGAIVMTNGNIVAENVIFDSNTVSGHSALSGGALYIGGSNATGKASSFKNCVFNANEGTKGGPIYFNAVGNDTKFTFEGCAITNNLANGTFGGSAFYIRFNAPTKAEINIINCTIRGNKVTGTASGGIFNWAAKTPNTAKVNIINCTITENTTGATAAGSGAGIYFANGGTTGNYGNLYISNCIIEGNKTDSGLPSDLNVTAISPATAGGGSSTVPGYIIVQNSMIGTVTSNVANVPATTNIVNSPSYNYITAASLPADYISKLDAFDTTTNSYALLDGSAAIGYGSTAFLTSLSPSVTTDQLGKTRPTPNCSAGSVEKNPVLGLKNNSKNSIAMYRNANNQITVENTDTDYTGTITVYNTLGQEVAKQAVKSTVTTIEKTLNAGVYIVMLNNAKGSNSKKIIIN